ncbi:Pantothenate kinase type III, CoaX-like protein [Arcticibacter svalbardensis MN12-7]|uniref:Type III pantothenate kinase n=1 Tax=Arcticibacter svalbardensis MN12-7 TaxID=1150600 RepID=R9H298_9SPHI|nr:type III pantothenate kinase [Arcticibacter svalbardensis]EOR95339.1 Pantothenate kinase type III, CoaX-like protein [Arcticibacter svalbardensis MN12-7]
MVNLVIDIGNTFSKMALFNNRELKDIQVTDSLSVEAIHSFSHSYAIKNAIISSVKEQSSVYEEYLKSRCNFIRFTTTISSRIDNQYKTPQTLGLDRFAAIIGSEALFPESNCLAIDAGTCITYDFLDDKRKYSGGIISPGLKMRLKSMHAFTERLPLVELDEDFEASYGKNTQESLLAGVLKGSVHEMYGFINDYFTKWPDLKVLICGGDANFFVRQLKNSIFARIINPEPNLVLIGLNEVIHQHNE